MKKIIISALAAMSLVACVQEEIVTVNQPNAIAFENAFVENATRAAVDPSTTTGTIAGFNVWAFMDAPAGVVFQGDEVTKSGDVWTYTNTQYWTPNHTYYFAAVSPIAGNWELETAEANTDGPGVISFTNVDGSEDLLYAATSVDTPRELDLLKEGMDPVRFQFSHLLSKVKFAFTNGFATSNASVKVSNVTMKAAKTGTLALNTADWWVGDKWNITGAEKTAYAFGDVETLGMGATAEAMNERLIMPAGKDYEFEVSFEVTLYMGTVEAMNVTKTAVVTGVALEMGKAYKFAAEINPENLYLPSIEFEVVEVKEWDNVAEPVAVSTPVATAAQLLAAVNAGENIVLTQDINLDELASKAAVAGIVLNKDVVINGNGYTVSTTAGRAFQIIDAKNVTIKNLNLVAGGERGFQLQTDGQTLVLEDVTAVAANYTLNITSNATNAKVTVNNCDFKGLNTVNVWGENADVTINNSTLRTEDNAAEGYATVCNNAPNGLVTVNGGAVVITGTSNNTYAGLVTSNSQIVFNGTEGANEVKGHSYAINYGEYRYTFASFAQAYETAQAGETIVLLKDVTLDTYLNVAGKDITIDLNGKNITAASNGDATAFGVGADAKLTVVGEGQVKATGRTMWVYGANAEVVVNGGHFVGSSETSECEVMYVNGANSKLIINGGKFESAHPSVGTADEYAVLNIADNVNKTSAIVVNGGSFHKFNPADNKSEGAGTNFVAAGKTVEQQGEWYIVK